MQKLFISLLCIFSCINLWSQKDLTAKTIEVTYVKAYKNYQDASSAPPKLLKNLEYQLLFNNREARFKYIKSMALDGDHTNSRFVGKGGGDGIYYKNLIEKEKLRLTNSPTGEAYLVEENFDKYKWKLHKETKKILGYDCFKATTEFTFYGYFRGKNITLNITAWYAPSLPSSFGPAGYDGLPGLVLESHQASFYLIATDIKFHKEPKRINRPENGIEITEEQFNKTLFRNMLEHNKLSEEEYYNTIENMNQKM